MHTLSSFSPLPVSSSSSCSPSTAPPPGRLQLRDTTLSNLGGVGTSATQAGVLPYGVYGAVHVEGAAAVRLSNSSCSGVRDAHGWACLLVDYDAAEPAPLGPAGAAAVAADAVSYDALPPAGVAAVAAGLGGPGAVTGGGGFSNRSVSGSGRGNSSSGSGNGSSSASDRSGGAADAAAAVVGWSLVLEAGSRVGNNSVIVGGKHGTAWGGFADPDAQTMSYGYGAILLRVGRSSSSSSNVTDDVNAGNSSSTGALAWARMPSSPPPPLPTVEAAAVTTVALAPLVVVCDSGSVLDQNVGHRGAALAALGAEVRHCAGVCGHASGAGCVEVPCAC